MQASMESMQEGFPSGVMFENFAATREKTERILEFLEKSGDGDD